MGLLVVVLLSNNLVLLVSDLVLCQSLLFVVSMPLCLLHPQNNSVNFFLSFLVNLSLLELQVLVDHSGHSFDVWESLLVVLLQHISRLLDVLPTLHFLVDAKVGQDGRRASRYTRRAMYKHFVVFVFQDVLDNLSAPEELVVVVGVGVIDVAVLDDVDTVLLVEVHHTVVGDFSFFLFNSGHQVHDGGDSVLSQDGHIFLILWVGADRNSSVRDLGDSEVSQEVSITLFNNSIDEESLRGHSLVARLSVTKEAVVLVWIFDIEHSHGVSLNLVGTSSSSSELVVVVEISLIGRVDSFRRRQLIDPLCCLIRGHVLSILVIKPVNRLARSLHLDWAQLCKIPLVSGNEENGIIVLIGVRIWRVENGEPDLSLLPSVVELNELLKAAVHVLPSLSEIDAL